MVWVYVGRQKAQGQQRAGEREACEGLISVTATVPQEDRKVSETGSLGHSKRPVIC